MSHQAAGRMDALDINQFLEEHQTGVLSLGKDNDGYGIPVSYLYLEDESNIYFRLGYAPNSQKRAYVDASERVTFVVYGKTQGRWKSVVAEGSLDTLSMSSLDSSIVEAVKCLEIPFFKVFERPTTELEFNIVRLAPSGLTGVEEARF